MTRTERVQDYRSFWVLLVAIGMLAGVVITSCGGGDGGSSNGGLCEQCGDDPDGPCQPVVQVSPGPDAPKPCDSPGAPNPCDVQLQCRRKSDSSQRRCFPLAPGGGDVDYQFRCDGSRPGGTPRPQPTATETPDPEPTSTAEQTCRNNRREGTEVCDGTDIGDETCASRGCSPPTGSLSCRIDCTGFNVSGCNGTGCRETD